MTDQPTLREVLEPSVERLTIDDIQAKLESMDYDEETGAKHLLYVDWLDDDTLKAASSIDRTFVTAHPPPDDAPTLIYVLQLTKESEAELIEELGDEEAVKDFIHNGNALSMAKYLFETLLQCGHTHLIEQMFPVIQLDLNDVMEQQCEDCDKKDYCEDRKKNPGLITRKVLDA